MRIGAPREDAVLGVDALDTRAAPARPAPATLTDIVSRRPGTKRSSELRIAIQSPRDIETASLRVAAAPLRSRATNRTRPAERAATAAMRAADPSVDPSSITTISSAARVWSRADASAASTNAAWSWLGTTTLTRPAGEPDAAAARDRASRATSDRSHSDSDSPGATRERCDTAMYARLRNTGGKLPANRRVASRMQASAERWSPIA